MTHTPVEDDGVIEPGERLRVTSLVLSNSGGLSLPASTRVTLSSLCVNVTGGWIRGEKEGRINVPKKMEVWGSLGEEREVIYIFILDCICDLPWPPVHRILAICENECL